MDALAVAIEMPGVMNVEINMQVRKHRISPTRQVCGRKSSVELREQEPASKCSISALRDKTRGLLAQSLPLGEAGKVALFLKTLVRLKLAVSGRPSASDLRLCCPVVISRR